MISMFGEGETRTLPLVLFFICLLLFGEDAAEKLKYRLDQIYNGCAHFFLAPGTFVPLTQLLG